MLKIVLENRSLHCNYDLNHSVIKFLTLINNDIMYSRFVKIQYREIYAGVYIGHNGTINKYIVEFIFVVNMVNV